MTLYKKLKSFVPLGRFSETPAKRIDDLYMQSTDSWLSRLSQFAKTRAIYFIWFPLCAALDVTVSLPTSLIFKLATYFTTQAEKKKYYESRAKKYADLGIKNLLGLLAAPLGLISPKYVAFYFIPRRERFGHVLSGGHLHSVHPEMQYPKTIAELQHLIKDANNRGKKITVVGAGRSQGQQFLPDTNNGVVINMQHFKHVTIHPETKMATVGAGATWGEIQLQANPHSLAVKVMQASNVFSVGGSISTNIHGWSKAGTVAKTLNSITIINAQGELLKLKPQDELFKYVVGGFNQFGVIVEAEIALTDNELLVEKSLQIEPSKYVEYFNNSVKENDNVRMHLYRLSLDPDTMLSEGVAVNYIETEKTRKMPTEDLKLESEKGTRFQRIFLNFMRRFSWLRKWYWSREKNNLIMNETQVTTNAIMQPPICAMFNHSLSESEWLQEYFIPPENLDAFLKELGQLLKQNHVPLINATVRYVKQDDITKMGYANGGDRFAVVLCFNQLLNPTDISKAKQWIRKSFDLALKNGGTYYLPYQPFASREQFEAGYPTAKEVYQKKLEVDPKGIFTSGFSKKYLAPHTPEHNHYKTILATAENRELFGQFLDNVLERVDKDKLYKLLDDIFTYADTKEEIYRELSKRIGEVMPNPLSSGYRIYHSLSSIKTDLSAQAAALMQGKGELPKVNGMVEIGFPGRFASAIKKKLNTTGTVTVINDVERWTDVIQSGYPKPYDRFVPLNDYDPISQEQIKDNSVDLITCFIGLHHIPEKKVAGFLLSLNRMLREGGSLLLVDHDVTDERTRDLASLAHSVYNAVMGAPLEEEMSEIRNFKSLKEWEDLLAKYGFEMQRVSDQAMVRKGDPTLNTMIRLVKKKSLENVLAVPKMVEEQPKDAATPNVAATPSQTMLFQHKPSHGRGARPAKLPQERAKAPRQTRSRAPAL